MNNIYLLLLVIGLSATAGAADSLVLGTKGAASRYQLVLPDSSPSETIAGYLQTTAELMQTAFAANDIEIGIVKEAERDQDRPGIFLGDTAFARGQGIEPSDLEGWGYRHRVIGEQLILQGRDEPNAGKPTERHTPGPRMGTIKAVTDFLHRYAGTRFLYPGLETGIEHLPTPTIAVPADLDQQITPNLRFNFSYGERYGMIGTTNLDFQTYLIANNYLPNVEHAFTAHSYPTAIPPDQYRESHPEYFALINGKRVVEQGDLPKAQLVHYCISNPAVQDLIYQELLIALDRGYDWTVVGQQDGFRACQCQACFDLYDTGTDWGEKLWLFHRELALRLEKERPGKMLVMLSYAHTWEPPKTFSTFPDNTIILLCRTDEASLAKWREVEVPGGYIAYLYLWGIYNELAYNAQRAPETVAHLVRNLHDFGTRGIFMDGYGQAYGMEGPTYYVYGRTWADPEGLETKVLLDEFYEAAFREVAGPMARFYGTLYHALAFYNEMPRTYTDSYGRTQYHYRRNPMQILRILFPADVLEELETQLTTAEQQATSEKVKRRLQLVRLEYDYLRHMATIAFLDEAYRLAPSYDSRESLLTAIDEWNAFLDPLFHPQHGWMTYRIEGWKGLPPFAGHSRHSVALPRLYKTGTPLDWDTKAMRAAPLPGAAQTIGLLTKTASPAWDELPAEPIGEIGAFRVAAGPDALHVHLQGEGTPPATIDLVLDPIGTRQSYYRFQFGPGETPRRTAASGFITDTLHPFFGKEDPTWDAPWNADLTTSDTGWQATISIPFTSLQIERPANGNLWRLNLALAETLWSSAGPGSAVGSADAMGELIFQLDTKAAAEDIHPIRRLRESLYEQTFRIPPEWQQMGGLHEDALSDWRFQIDPADTGEEKGWHLPEHDSSGWWSIEVPAFWAETRVGDYTGYGWYRAQLNMPESWKGEPVKLLVGSADEQAWIYLNGKLVGEHTIDSTRAMVDDLWDAPFAIDLPADILRTHNPATIAIRVHNYLGNGGIWRPVMLTSKKQ